jgi:A/G-specific adenine glycosylase
MPVESTTVTAALLNWYDRNARLLPWRVPPHAGELPDPYRVWLAEIMLQQTTVAVARQRFADFLTRWPTLADLARAEDAQVMAAWAGLGYYARARNLLATARTIMERHGGRFPGCSVRLATLPGVGPYTAAAVAAIAFGERVAVVDTNVMRVMARLCADPTPAPALRDTVAAALLPMVPADRPGDFAQAMMDLGAGLCTPRAPACSACPIAAACRARGEGQVHLFPVRPEKRPRPTRHGTAWWIESGESVALVRRPPRGLLGGMLGLPGTDWRPEPQAATLPFPASWIACPTPVRHVFTHFALELRLVGARIEGPSRPQAIATTPLVWTPLADLAGAGLPGLFQRAAAVAMDWRAALRLTNAQGLAA